MCLSCSRSYWGVASVWMVLENRSERVAQAVRFQAAIADLACTPISGSTLQPSEQRACDKAQAAPIVVDLEPPWLAILVIIVYWLVPLFLLLTVVAIARWVLRGFTAKP